MKVLVIYLGQAAQSNFAHSSQTGVWGFKPNMQPETDVNSGDALLFVSGFAGNIRLPEEPWLRHDVTLIATARIESPVLSESTPHWPDEIAENRILYPKRFKFSNLKRQSGRYPLSDPRYFPRELSLAIRTAALTRKGYVLEMDALPAWLNDPTATPSISPQVKPTELPQEEKPAVTKEITVPEVLLEIENYIASRGFAFPTRILRTFYASLRSKPFIILAGNSGTGKSRLVRLFAEASGANIANGRFVMIPVRPDWNDSSELLGYFDLNGDFVPGQLVAPILVAHQNPDRPFFVCLDEMNLAKVEHYFSDFLSIVESRRKDGNRIGTDPLLREVQLMRMKRDTLSPLIQDALEYCRKLGKPLGLPDNLYVVGTVNMDETTQPFSRKVLDRANTIEFNEIDLLQGIDEDVAASEIPALNLEQSFFVPEFTTLNDLLPAHRDTARQIAEMMTGLNRDLELAGFEVGYRVRDEAISFAVYAGGAGATDTEIDQAIVLQKILPRIHGSSPRVEKLLMDLLKRLKGDSEIPDEQDPEIDQKLSALRINGEASAIVRKIAGMLFLFREENFTSFWLA